MCSSAATTSAVFAVNLDIRTIFLSGESFTQDLTVLDLVVGAELYGKRMTVSPGHANDEANMTKALPKTTSTSFVSKTNS